MKRLSTVLVSVYLLMAMFTFGHAFNRIYHWQEAICVNSPPRSSCDSGFAGGAGGLLSGAAWPLYWSAIFHLDRVGEPPVTKALLV